MEEINLSTHKKQKYLHTLYVFEETMKVKNIYVIGKIYFHGLGVKKDLKKARIYLNQAAELNYEKAFYYLGYYCQYGLLENSNIYRAIYYYSKSLNYSKTLIQLGEIFNEGFLSINKDIKLAKRFYKQSLSIKVRGIACLKLGLHAVSKDVNKAKNYFLQGAAKKNGKCCYHLALLTSEKRRYFYRAVEYKDYYSCLELINFVKLREAERLLKLAYFKGNIHHALDKLVILYNNTDLWSNRKQIIYFFCKINQTSYIKQIYNYRSKDIRTLENMFKMRNENFLLKRENKIMRAHIDASPEGELFYSCLDNFFKEANNFT